MSAADSYNSDDERYADDTFEQESDTDAPEIAEIESEISEVSDEDNDEPLPTVKLNTGTRIRSLNYTNTISAPTNTDAVPFDSSSDEEDDVIVGQTFAEINTPSMHLVDSPSTTPTRRETRAVRRESSHPLNSVDEQSEGSVSEEEEDSDDEREFQRIQEMEERYLLQNAGKTQKTTRTEPQMRLDGETILNSVEQKTETETSDQDTEPVQKESRTNNEDTTSEPELDPIPELIERVMEHFTPKPEVAPQIQTDFVEIVQNSLASLQTDNSLEEQTDDRRTNNSLLSPEVDNSIRMTFSFEPNHILNPENVAMAFFNAMNATTATFVANNSMAPAIPTQEITEENANLKESVHQLNAIGCKEPKDDCHDFNETSDANDKHGYAEVELEHLGSASPPPISDDEDEDEESYYDTQFEYQITSKTPSCFNSEDYVFHANFIRPSPTTDKLRARPQPRKSMSFSNERMREIERHNQILLRKILTQKPTYVLKNGQHKVQPNNTNSQTNVRLTTSALNRKKQQRQIDLDNQVLKRKIEAISLRRRPLIS